METTNRLTVENSLYVSFQVVSSNITIAEGRKLFHDSCLVLIIAEDIIVKGLLFSWDLDREGLDPNISIQEIAHRDFSVMSDNILNQDLEVLLPKLHQQTIVILTADKRILGILDLGLISMDLNKLVRVSDARLNTLVETLDDAVCIINEQDEVIHWNKRAEKLYNIKKKEILGQKINKYFSNLVVTKTLRGKDSVSFEHHQPCEDTHVLISSNPIKLNKRIVGALSVERDITDIAQLYQKLTQVNSQVQELKNKINYLKSEDDSFKQIVGQNRKLLELIAIAQKVAATNVVVLLRGESGTGKDLFAWAIHSASQRADKPYIVVNCAAIPATLFESEVFGYEAGAFTGANKSGKVGLFESAHGGTLFLDEVGELPLDLQVKLLQVLQNKRFYRVGGSKPVQIDVRFITATNRNLEEMIAKSLFREDLFYRLNVVPIKIPSLRERREDIPDLSYRFIQEYNQQYGKQITAIDPGVMTIMLGYHWPGNIRELKNCIEQMVIMAEDNMITEDIMPAALISLKQSSKETYKDGLTLASEQTEREFIENILKQTKGNISKTSKILGIPRSTLYYKMNHLGITLKE